MESLNTVWNEESGQEVTEYALSATTRTGPLINQLIMGIQADIADAVEQLEAGLAMIRALEAHAKGVNGLASILKSKGNEVEHIIDVLSNEADEVARKMLGASWEPIMEHVDAAHLERVAESRKVG